jgi:hypothetical protein
MDDVMSCHVVNCGKMVAAVLCPLIKLSNVLIDVLEICK